jgi:hypothetical protein
VVEDFFSKWVEAFPLRRTVAPSVAQCVLNGWISRFGCPFTILSDQGSEFESNLFRSLNDMLQVKKLRTTTYHPRTDGMVERSNRTIVDILSKYGEGEADWDLKLPLVLFAIRTSEHATTGFSPFALTYGREARLPWDILYGPAPKTPTPLEDWVAERKAHMTKVFQMVRECTSRMQRHQKEYFDKNRSGKFQHFEEGELVMYFDPACRLREGKLHRPWSGPHRVVEKVTDALYKIEIGPDNLKMVNAERIKRYHQRGVAIRDDQKDFIVKSPEGEDSDDEGELDSIDSGGEDDMGDPRQGQGGELLGHDVLPEHHMQQRYEGIPEPLMGHRGELWANVDPRNIIREGRRVRN